jgi:transcription factor C subunit 6
MKLPQSQTLCTANLIEMVGTQYLALGTLPLAGKGDAVSMKMSQDSEEIATSSAFAPAPPTPTCIQIWSFPISVEPGKQVLDSSIPPKLYFGICTDWGNIKHFKWCPTQSPQVAESTDDMTSFGLLAGIWSDGKLRVLDVQHRKGRDSPEYSENTVFIDA